MKAFPKTSRSDLLNIIGQSCIEGGTLASLCGIFQWDEVVVLLSGTSAVTVNDGIPEGGTLGTTLYTCLPDSLVKELLSLGMGIGLKRTVPPAWAGHVWKGSGTPCTNLVRRLLLDVKDGRLLPEPDALQAWPDLEASALKVIDLLSAERLAALLHADDPVFLASSRGELQNMLDVIADWAHRHKATFHTGKAKSVVMPIYQGCDESAIASLAQVDMIKREEGVPTRVALHVTLSHRWLGLPWSASLNFTAALQGRLAAADSTVRELASLVASGALPLPVAAEVFEAKVDSYMAYGRWLFACEPEAEDSLNRKYGAWALQLLGAQPWRRSAAATSEMGWRLTGYARGLRDMALHRARVMCYAETDLYSQVYRSAASVPTSWNRKSASILRRLNLPMPEDMESFSKVAYTTQVTKALQEMSQHNLEVSLQESSQPLPYLCVQMPTSPALQACLASDLPWEVLANVKSWCRLRAGLVDLACRDGRRSGARHRSCIFCNEPSNRNPLKHVLGICQEFNDLRQPFLNQECHTPNSSEEIALCVLSQEPGSENFPAAVRLCTEVDRRADMYWSEARGS